MLLFAKLLKRFHRDESGAFAVIFGVMAIILIAMGGSAIDFVAIQQSRASAQISMDAAVLALQPKIHTQTQAQIKETAEKLLIEGIDNATVTVTMLDPVIDKDAGSLNLKAKISLPTFFVKFVSIDKLEALIESEATRARNRLEIAMVLDNSGSMDDFGRIGALRSAAALAVDIISEYKAFPDKVFFGLVPFTDMINVDPANRNATWLDQYGRSSISWDNFDDDDNSTNTHDITSASGRLSRFDVYDSMNNVSWAGCVEARPHDTSLPFAERLDVYDKEPTSADGDTFIVPVFQADTPDGTSYRWNYLSDTNPACSTTTSTGTCTYREWTGRYAYPGSSSTYNPDWGFPSNPNNTCSCAGRTITSSSSYWDWYYGTMTTQTCRVLGLRERQERVCKYVGRSPAQVGEYSPNSTCTVDPIAPLTNDMNSIKTKINAMEALGGTNIHMGAMWGLRVLSPQEPFSQGVGYDKGASKVMIIMTDGENTAYPSGDSFNNTYFYSMYGFHYNQRLGNLSSTSAELSTEMNRRTLQVCTNAKAEGIEVYTIGLSVDAASANAAMLTSCATDIGKVYFPASSSDLEDVFKAIADQLSDLRLSK